HRLCLAQLLDSYGIGDDLHRTLNGFFSTCNSGHDETLGK
ncbi:MAG: hypothetical protein ACI90C_001066, partial [Rhodoferax sp.]